MSFGLGRKRRLESVISTFILIILFLIGAGVFVKQLDTDISRFGIETETSQTDQILLGSASPAGYDALPETEVYKADNLYEKINGKAPFYTESGFVKLLTQRFINKDDENLWAELYAYDMATTRNAFSVYSRQRRFEAKPLSDFSFGYKTDNGLYFARGKYYVELVGSAKSEDLFDSMSEAAKKLQSQINIDSDIKIAEINLFAENGLVPETIKLYLADAFGFEGLTDTFAAIYEIDGEEVTAFLSNRTNEKDAAKIAKSYHDFLLENGAVSKKANNKTFEGKVLDFYGDIKIVFSTGPFVGGISEAQTQDSAEKLAMALFDKLSKTAKAENND